jgi:hypothetical protein
LSWAALECKLFQDSKTTQKNRKLNIPGKLEYVADYGKGQKPCKIIDTHLPGHLFVDFWMGDSVKLLSLLFILKK